MQKKPWRPPVWLITIDVVAIVLFGLGLHMHYIADSAISQALPPMLKLPLLILGAAMLVAGMVGAIRLLLIHQKH